MLGKYQQIDLDYASQNQPAERPQKGCRENINRQNWNMPARINQPRGLKHDAGNANKNIPTKIYQ